MLIYIYIYTHIYIYIYMHIYQIANIRWIIEKVSRKTSISALWTMPWPLTVWITTNWKILQEMRIPDPITCLLRNLYAGQEERVRTGCGTTDWFQIGKRVYQGYILSLCLFNLCKVHHAKCWPGWSPSWNQDCQKKYQSQTCRWHHPYGRKWRGYKMNFFSESQSSNSFKKTSVFPLGMQLNLFRLWISIVIFHIFYQTS